MEAAAGAINRSYRASRGLERRRGAAVPGSSIALDEATKGGDLVAQSCRTDRDAVDGQVLLARGRGSSDDEETGCVGADLIRENDGPGVESLLDLRQVQRVRILHRRETGRRRANAFDDVVPLLAQLALTSTEAIDVRGVALGIEFRERPLHTVVFLTKLPRRLLQLRRQVSVQHQVPLGEHHQKATSAGALKDVKCPGRLAQAHQNVDVFEVDGAALAGVRGTHLV